MLELDHVFCMVTPDDDWAGRLVGAGWRLDGGMVHEGQGTRNRRLIWADNFLELLWVHDAGEARRNALRLDRRAEGARTGASPFGIGLRGRLSEADRADFWLYDGLSMPVWVHRDNDDAPQHPFVFVIDLGDLVPRSRQPGVPLNAGALLQIRHTGPAPAPLPAYTGPELRFTPGPHRIELAVDRGEPVAVTPELALVSAP